jgi:hypothetical protein
MTIETKDTFEIKGLWGLDVWKTGGLGPMHYRKGSGYSL